MKFFDGGFGTMLQRFGLATGDCPEAYNLSHPEIVQKIHKAYVEAGAQFLTTNTFGGSPLKLADYGLEDKVEEIAAAAVRNAKAAAAGTAVKVAGDIGPTGKFLAPLGDLSFQDAYDNFYRQAKALGDAGADVIILETFIDIQEMKAALLAAKDATGLPVICSMTYTEEGRTITGTDPKTAVILLDALGADVIGANCSVGPDKLLAVAKQMVPYTNKPIIIQPNAGMPVLENGETKFPLTAEAFSQEAKNFATVGVSYLGGCCGTTPEHIKETIAAIATVEEQKPEPVKPFTALTSRTQTVFVGDDYAPVMIGERINPTGRKKMREALKEGSFTYVKKEALAEVDAGADILDVNMGVPGADQVVLMKQAMLQLTMLCPVPFSIDSTDPAVLEAALQIYPGRPLINSANAENEETMLRVLKLAKRYGAAVLCLPLEKGNMPKTAEGRIRIIHYIAQKAKEVGLRHEDLLVDPLVLTVGSGGTAARETLRTIRLYKEEFGFPCVMGTSNVSFGLPNRPRINAAFLTMAFACGMNAPIINPLDRGIQKAFVNAKLLLGFDKGALNYINDATNDEPPEPAPQGPARTKKPQAGASPAVDASSLPAVEQLKLAVKQGEKDSAASLTQTCIEQGMPSEEIIKNGLTAAMTEIGAGWSAGKVFLPQVMMAAEAMQASFKIIKKMLPGTGNAAKGILVIGTVQGDIHDLGKNIVAALMENSGYKVIDLGKDVSPEQFLEAAKSNRANLVGLCSLMTTTLPELEKTVKYFKEKLPGVAIMAGGAVVTRDYAESVGADAYCKDGIAAVREADRLMQERKGA